MLTGNLCPLLCGLFPCMCKENRPAAQSYNDPLVPQNSPFSSQPHPKRRASAPSSFLQRILGLGLKLESAHPQSQLHQGTPVQPMGPTRTPPSNACPPLRSAMHQNASAQPPATTTQRRRRQSTPGYTQILPQPLATSSRLPTQTPVMQQHPLPEDTPEVSASWYRPRPSRQSAARTPYSLARAAAPAYTPQVAPAVLPEVSYPSKRRQEPILSRPRRKKPRTRTGYAMPATHGSKEHAAPVAPPAMHIPQTSPEYQSYSQLSAPEEPLYFANDAHDPLRWIAPECRLPRGFIFKGRRFWSVAQAVSWWKACAAGDMVLARVIENLDPALSKREFERRESHLANAICTPARWVQGSPTVYKTVVSAAFASDEAGMRTLLLETGHRHLVWDSPDWDWGRGGNRYGHILMDVRSQLRQEVHTGAHRMMEHRMPPTNTHRVSSRHHRTQETVYPYTGYSDLRQRPSRSGRHHVQFNPTPMVRII